jgi:hypothetical protein
MEGAKGGKLKTRPLFFFAGSQLGPEIGRIEVHFWAENGGGGRKFALRLRSGSSKARFLG